MDPAPTLTALAPFSPPSRTRPLMIATLVINGGLVLGGAAEVRSLQERLENLTSRSQQHAEATRRTDLGLTALGDQSRVLSEVLLDLRRSASTSSLEDALFLKIMILKPAIEPALARRIAVAVQRECAREGQDPNLVLSVMAVESSFNPNAVSSAGAVGLMQVMPLWKETLGMEQLAEPEVSIRAGTQILSRYQQKFRDLDLALTAYNRGPGTVSQALANGESPANGYSAKVLGLWQRLKAIDDARQGWPG